MKVMMYQHFDVHGSIRSMKKEIDIPFAPFPGLVIYDPDSDSGKPKGQSDYEYVIECVYYSPFDGEVAVSNNLVCKNEAERKSWMRPWKKALWEET